MVTTFISLLGSLAQANFVWNGDIVLNVAMAGGGIDWLGLLGLAIIIGVAQAIASRKHYQCGRYLVYIKRTNFLAHTGRLPGENMLAHAMFPVGIVP